VERGRARSVIVPINNLHIFDESENANMNSTIRQTPFGEVDMSKLADILDVRIDTSQPIEERRKSYLRQIRNPYLYRCDDVIVKVSFAESGATLKDRLRQYFQSAQGIRL
jgi:hypothetical protein